MIKTKKISGPATGLYNSDDEEIVVYDLFLLMIKLQK